MTGTKGMVIVNIPHHVICQLCEKYSVEFEITSRKTAQGETEKWTLTATVSLTHNMAFRRELEDAARKGLLRIISPADPMVVETVFPEFRLIPNPEVNALVPIKIVGDGVLCSLTTVEVNMTDLLQRIAKCGVTVQVLREEPRVLCG